MSNTNIHDASSGLAGLSEYFDATDTRKLAADDIHNSLRWEYEEIALDRGSSGLGFTVAGGLDDPHYHNDYSIYITRLVPNGPAALDGRLKLEDIIVRVDDIELIDVKHRDAVSALKNSGNRVQLLIKRRSPIVVKDNLNHSSNANNSSYNSFRNQPLNNSTYSSNASPTTPASRFSNSTTQQLAKQSSNDLPIQRGSSHYSTTREVGYVRNPRLKAGSSSLSLQNPEEVDSNNGLENNFSRDNNNYGTEFSKSTSAIDSDVTKNITKLPRTVVLQRSRKRLGFNLVGGTAGGGTFISFIEPGGVAGQSNKLHCGDQILSVNGVNLRSATHEEVANSLKQAGQTVKLVVKYKPEEYIKFENKINDLRERNMLSTGTLQTSQKKSLYARALFDYDPSKDSGLPSKGLSFRFGDILHIINASDDEWWRARRVLDNGQDDIVSGIIPSKKRVEKREKARLKSVKFNNRNYSESMLAGRKKFSFSKKFPFMKSRENMGNETEDFDPNGSQTNYRKILASSSTTSINNNSERASMRYDMDDVILSYDPVLQHNINYVRPVALYGPIKEDIEALKEDLCCDERFYRMEQIVPYTTRPPKRGEVDGVKYHFVSEDEMRRHRFVEAGELNNYLYGTSIESIREVAELGKHCLLNISPKAIKRLQDAKLYPIVVFIKPSSIESLLEMNKRWSHEEAVSAMDQANRLEQEFGPYFTATIQMDAPNEVLREVMNVISQQSGPRIWVPTTFEALNVT